VFNSQNTRLITALQHRYEHRGCTGLLSFLNAADDDDDDDDDDVTAHQ